jgi:NAD(P)H-hydrate epimerase
VPHGHDTVVVAKDLAAMLNAVVVAKGPVTQVVAVDGSHSSSTGTVALAKAGTGDVLSGMIGSLLAQGMSPFEAAKLGVELHGQAGRLAEQRLGRRSVCAEDLLETLPLALKAIDG